MPAILGVDSLARLGATFNFPQRTVCFQKLGVHFCIPRRPREENEGVWGPPTKRSSTPTKRKLRKMRAKAGRGAKAVRTIAWMKHGSEALGNPRETAYRGGGLGCLGLAQSMPLLGEG